jgi:hypothetical protein
MSHLGRWLSAQIDGELDGIERDRVLNHIAGCDACRTEANALRALKRRMTALGDTASNTDIAGKLIELARSDGALAIPAGKAAWTAARAPAKPAIRQPWLNWRIATCSAGSALLAIGVIAFMLGGVAPQNQPVPRVTPAVDAYWTEHIFDTGELPGTTAGLSQSSQQAGISRGVFVPVGLWPAGQLSSPGPAPFASQATSQPPAGGAVRPRALIRPDAP